MSDRLPQPRPWGMSFDAASLGLAWAHVRRSPGVGLDGVRPQDVDAAFLARLADRLASGRYRPAPLLRRVVAKPSGGLRQLGVPGIPDRIVQTALRQAWSPLVDRSFHPNSHGWRPGRGVATALAALSAFPAGARPELAQVDLEALFDALPHDRVCACLPRDPVGVALVDRWLAAWPTTPGRGIPQGAPLSPLLANLVLDAAVDQRLGRGPWVRYGDDWTGWSDGPGSGLVAAVRVADLARHAGLSLSPRKSRITRAGDGGVAVILGAPVSFARGPDGRFRVGVNR